jgi:hypothetical protein
MFFPKFVPRFCLTIDSAGVAYAAHATSFVRTPKSCRRDKFDDRAECRNATIDDRDSWLGNRPKCRIMHGIREVIEVDVEQDVDTDYSYCRHAGKKSARSEGLDHGSSMNIQ